MATSLTDLTKVIQDSNNTIQEGNNVQEYILIENNQLLTSVQNTLVNIQNTFEKFSADYQASVNQQMIMDNKALLAAKEAALESERKNGKGGAGASSGTVDNNTPELEKLEGSMVGALVVIASLTKFFGNDSWVRLGATLGSLEGAFSNIVTTVKGGITKSVTSIGTFVEAMSKTLTKVMLFFKNIGSSIKTFLTSSKAINDVFGKIVNGLKAIIGPIGTLLKKIALPLTVIFAIIDGISGFMKEFAETGSILSGIKGAIVGIIDGLIGTLVRLAGDVVAFIFEFIGLDAVADTVKNFTSSITAGIMEALGGLVDVVLGLLSFDLGRITDGLGALLGGLWDSLSEALLFPINMMINFVRDIFGFSDEDVEPFRMQDMIGEAIDSIKEFFTDLFTFEWPEFNFDPMAILANLLPDQDSWAAKLIPDSVYKKAGLTVAPKDKADAGAEEEEAPKTRAKQTVLKTRKDTSGLEQGELKTRKDTSGLEQGELKTPGSKEPEKKISSFTTNVADSWLDDPDIKELLDNIKKGAKAGKSAYDVIIEMAEAIDEDNPGSYNMAEMELKMYAEGPLGIDDIYAVPDTTKQKKVSPPPSPKQDAAAEVDPPAPAPAASKKKTEKKTPGLAQNVQDTAPVASLFAEDGKEIRAAIIAGAKHEDRKDPAWVIMEMADGDMIKEEELRLIAMSELGLDDLYEIPEWAIPKGGPSKLDFNFNESGTTSFAGPTKSKPESKGKSGLKQGTSSKKKSPLATAAAAVSEKKTPGLVNDVQKSGFAGDVADIKAAIIAGAKHKDRKEPDWVIMEMADGDSAKEMELRLIAQSELGLDDLSEIPEWAIDSKKGKDMAAGKSKPKAKQSVLKTRKDKSGLKQGQLKTPGFVKDVQTKSPVGGAGNAPAPGGAPNFKNGKADWSRFSQFEIELIADQIDEGATEGKTPADVIKAYMEDMNQDANPNVKDNLIEQDIKDFSGLVKSTYGIKDLDTIMEEPINVGGFHNVSGSPKAGSKKGPGASPKSNFLPTEFSTPSIGGEALTPEEVSQTATPVPLKSLSAPAVSEATSGVADAKAAAPQIIAPVVTTDSSVTNNNSTSVNNSTTITSPSARSSDPTFMRMQNAVA